MVGDLIGGAEAVVQAGKLVSTVSQLNPWETVAVIGTIGAFGTSWLRSAALPTDPTFGPIVAAASAAAGTVDANGTPCGPASQPRRSFVCSDGLLYLRSPRGDLLCIPEAGGLRLQVL